MLSPKINPLDDIDVRRRSGFQAFMKVRTDQWYCDTDVGLQAVLQMHCNCLPSSLIYSAQPNSHWHAQWPLQSDALNETISQLK